MPAELAYSHMKSCLGCPWGSIAEPVLGEDLAGEVSNTLEDALIIFAEFMIGLGSIGGNFQQAITDDPVNAFYGMAYGIGEGSPIGLAVNILHYASGLRCRETNELGWCTDAYSTNEWGSLWSNVNEDNEAFQAGRTIGVFGVSVADVIVGAQVAVDGATTIGNPTLRVAQNLGDGTFGYRVVAVLPGPVAAAIGAIPGTAIGLDGAINIATLFAKSGGYSYKSPRPQRHDACRFSYSKSVDTTTVVLDFSLVAADVAAINAGNATESTDLLTGQKTFITPSGRIYRIGSSKNNYVYPIGGPGTENLSPEQSRVLKLMHSDRKAGETMGQAFWDRNYRNPEVRDTLPAERRRLEKIINNCELLGR